MNVVQGVILKDFVISKIATYEEIMGSLPLTLLEALDEDMSIEDAIMDVLSKQAYSQPVDLKLSTDSIDQLLRYKEDKDLSLEFGIGSVLESYVIDNIGRILGIDLLEWI